MKVIIKFVKITHMNDDGVDLAPCRQFLKFFIQICKMEIESIEFFFIVPKGILRLYEIGLIESENSLEEFGWPATQVRSQIKILGIDF